MDGQPIGRFLEACGATGPLELEVFGPTGRLVGRWSLAQPFAVIGRDPRADVALGDEQVSVRHVYLQIVGGRVFGVDLGSRTGVWWGGEAQASGWLDAGDSIGIGPYRVRLVGPAGPGRPGKAWLEATALVRLPGGEAAARASLEFPDMVPGPVRWRPRRVLSLVGRSSRCQLKISDGGVSLFHGALLRTPAGVWAVDLLSREGTRINGTLVRSGRLDDGDVVQVTRYRMRVTYEGSEGEAGDRAGEDPSGAVEAVSIPELPPDGLPMPAMAAPPVLSVREALAGRPPDQVAVIESAIEPILAQFGQMQQQLFEQFHQAMMMMFQMFGAMHREQMGLVREELEEIRRLSGELQELRAKATEPRLAVLPEAEPGAPPAEEKGEASALAPPRNGAEGPKPRGAATGRAAAAPPGAAEPGPDRGEVHDLLLRRMAEIQQERQSRWRKILDLVTGGD